MDQVQLARARERCMGTVNEALRKANEALLDLAEIQIQAGADRDPEGARTSLQAAQILEQLRETISKNRHLPFAT